MDDIEKTPGRDIDPAGAQEFRDQDSEATMNAPEEDRPDGLVGLEDDDDSESTGGEASPS